jgi:hypothetical protein
MNNLSITVEEIDAASRTEELCTLFSTTVASLAADAAALRQLKSLAIGVDEENDNPNVKHELIHIEFLVTDLEGKVRMLQEIVAEEKRSLTQMQSIKDAAVAQNQILQGMLRSRDNAIILREEEEEAVSPVTIQTEGALRPGVLLRQVEAVAVSTQAGQPISVPRSGGHRRDSIDPRQPSQSFRFSRVSESEWNNVSRNIRGRITLAVVNDALNDMERVFRIKYAVLQNPSRKSREHQKLLNSHREVRVEEHGDDPWVSEQDFRQYCAFFRNGESTARAILLILRTLKRLKQVPGKNSQVTYIYLQD